MPTKTNPECKLVIASPDQPRLNKGPNLKVISFQSYYVTVFHAHVYHAYTIPSSALARFDKMPIHREIKSKQKIAISTKQINLF